jgi:hypothetical protein
MSGTDRPELRKALEALSEGDVLVVTRLDRLARSTRDLLDIVHTIETRGAKLKALTDSWADTTTPTGKLILTVLGGLAEFERSLIAERTAEGRDRAKRAGRRLGRGYDAGKRIKGRKRHIVTDTVGLLIGLVVHSAGIQDRPSQRCKHRLPGNGWRTRCAESDRLALSIIATCICGWRVCRAQTAGRAKGPRPMDRPDRQTL